MRKASYLFLALALLATPRAMLRKLEVGVFCLMPVLMIAFVYFGMIGGLSDPPQVIIVH